MAGALGLWKTIDGTTPALAEGQGCSCCCNPYTGSDVNLLGYSYCSIKPIGVAAGSGEPVWSVASGSRGSAGAAVQGQASAHGRDRGGCVAFRSDGRMGGIRDHWKA